MFTGIVEEIGTVRKVERRSGGQTFWIGCRTVLEGTRVGDSIAVNGVCLTVTSLSDDGFTCDAMPETLKRTNLGDLRPGDGVNLERALAVGARMGGHFVQGHVDGLAEVVAVRRVGEALLYTFRIPRELARYVAEKGFVAVDGVSLTAFDVGPETFTVSLVRHTQEHITLPRHGVGYRANLEVDILAKYLERLLLHRREGKDGVDWEALLGRL